MSVVVSIGDCKYLTLVDSPTYQFLSYTEYQVCERTTMASEDKVGEKPQEKDSNKKMKILCLHGFRTSGAFLKKQISKWDPSIFADFDLDFPDGEYPAGGKSDIEGIFPPPYFEWFQFEKEFTVYFNLEECISRLCDYITTNGPFHGLLGFSQGTSLAGLLLGYQAQGKVLKDHPPFKLFIAVSGSKFRAPSICDVAYKDPISVKSVHCIGEKDWLKLPSEDLASAFVNPLIIRHPQGHTVPRLDEAAVEKMRAWTAGIVAGGKEVGKESCPEKVSAPEVAAALEETEKKEEAALAEAGVEVVVQSGCNATGAACKAESINERETDAVEAA